MSRANATYRDLAQKWKALRGTHDVRIREVACVNAPRTLLCVETGDASQPTIALASGVHGDEPAGPWALLALVEERSLNPRFAYRMWPCTNPTGFDAHTRASIDGVDVNRTFGRGGGSPEARAIITANRDFKFVLSIDLHEDADAAGFYCYEYGGGTIGRTVIATLDRAGFPIEPLDDFDLGGPLDAHLMQRERGRVTADPFAEAQHLGGLSYSLALARNAARRALTFETPGGRPFDERVAMHVCAVTCAIAALDEDGRNGTEPRPRER